MGVATCRVRSVPESSLAVPSVQCSLLGCATTPVSSPDCTAEQLATLAPSKPIIIKATARRTNWLARNPQLGRRWSVATWHSKRQRKEGQTNAISKAHHHCFIFTNLEKLRRKKNATLDKISNRW